MSDPADRAAQFLIWRGPAVFYALVIIFMSSLPGSEIPEMPFRFGDKLVHALEFGLFGMFLYRAFRFPNPFPHPFRMTLALGIIFAASDEIHQLFVPGRFCSVADFLFDCIGFTILAAVAAKIHPAPPAGETRNTMNSIPSPGGKR